MVPVFQYRRVGGGQQESGFLLFDLVAAFGNLVATLEGLRSHLSGGEAVAIGGVGRKSRQYRTLKAVGGGLISEGPCAKGQTVGGGKSKAAHFLHNILLTESRRGVHLLTDGLGGALEHLAAEVVFTVLLKSDQRRVAL